MDLSEQLFFYPGRYRPVKARGGGGVIPRPPPLLLINVGITPLPCTGPTGGVPPPPFGPGQPTATHLKNHAAENLPSDIP